MTRWLSVLTLALTLALPAAAQVPAEKCLATMQPADGFQVELFAAEPMLLNPTAMDVDHKGRVWVAEAVNYRRKNFNRPLLRNEGDRIVVLTDTNADGKADAATTFYQASDLYGPLSVCVLPQLDGKSLRVLVAQSPDILEFWDRDGDLKADGPPKKFLTGFGGFDHDHGVHGLSVGPDGKLYFTVGDSGVNGLQSSDGKGRKWQSNTIDVQKGTVWRCDLDGTNLELIAHNFRNNYEACVDSFGEIWLSDNDDDGNQQTRICFVMPGGNYGYGPRGSGQSHWHEEQPGIVHKVLRTGFGSPTGITIYEGKLFSGKYRDAILHCDAGPREVRAFFRRPKGAGYELDKEVILTSTDNWFRPSDVTVAPDGSIFVCDWYDPGVGGHGMGDWTRGRIFRLTPSGHKGYTVPEVKLDTKEGVLAAVSSPCLASRALGIGKLKSMPATDAVDAIWPGLESDDRTLSARCIDLLLQQSNRPKGQQLPAAVGFKIQNWLVGYSKGRSDVQQLLIRRIGGPEGMHLLFPPGHNPDFDRQAWVKTMPVSVWREQLIQFGHPLPGHEHLVTPEVVKPWFYDMAKQYKGNDHFYLAALNIALGTDPARRDAILADFDKHFPEWNDTVADLVWELRPKSALPRLAKLLADPKLTGEQRGRIIQILAASDDPAAGQTMIAVLNSDALPAVKAAAVEQLRLFLPTKWAGLRNSRELADAIDKLLAKPESTVTGLQLVAAAGATGRVNQVAEIIGNGDFPLDTRKEAIRTLGRLRTPKSVENLGAIVVFAKDIVLQKEAIAALGGMVGNQAKDEVGTSALNSLQTLVTNASVGGELRLAAVEALAGSPPGTNWLLTQKEQGKLPKELDAETGRLLRNSPFQGQRNKALLLFPAPGKLDPKKLPAIAELAKRNGDAGRGKQVWNASLGGASQCAKCHMVRSVGGQVGPDLSMIGKKASKENLFESILDPSRAIADQYVQHSVTTSADLTVSGLLVGDTPQGITLRDANGKDTTVPKGDIVGEVRKLKVSIMPQDIVAALTEDELVDLVAYMQTLQTPALTPDSFRVVGPFNSPNGNAGVRALFGPEKGAFDPAAKFDVKGGQAGWKSIRPDGKGYFDLAGFHGQLGANSVSYMYAEIESPTDQDAEMLLGSDDGAKLWVNGEDVFVTDLTRAAAPEQDRVKVKLRKGKNTVLLKVANGNNPHGFYFSLVSKDETKVIPTR